jgi:hypothetical protein
MWNESTAIWNKGAKILQVYMAPAAISTEGLATALDPDESLRYGIEGDYVILTLDEKGEFSLIYAYIEDGSKNYGFNEGTVELQKMGPDVVSGRVSSGGKKSLGDTPISFDLRFEAAILPPPPKGADLGKDGGAPGAAYLAYSGPPQATMPPWSSTRQGVRGRACGHARGVPAVHPGQLRKRAPGDGDHRRPALRRLRLVGCRPGSTGDKVEGKVKMVPDGDTWRLPRRTSKRW